MLEKVDLTIKELVEGAIRDAKSKIKYSTNLISEQDKDLPQYKEIYRKMNNMRAVEISHPLYSVEWITETARLAEQYAVGNCCEMDCIAFLYMKNRIAQQLKDERPSLELFNNPFLDHFFVVLSCYGEPILAGFCVLKEFFIIKSRRIDMSIRKLNRNKYPKIIVLSTIMILLLIPFQGYAGIQNGCADNKSYHDCFKEHGCYWACYCSGGVNWRCESPKCVSDTYKSSHDYYRPGEIANCRS